jgi:methylmalonic acid semialdehyde dehydrogenase
MSPTSLKLIQNVICGKAVPSSTGTYLPVLSPLNNEVIASVALSNASDVSSAVEAAKEAFYSWSSLTMKSRAAIMLKFHSLVETHQQELAELISLENGKNITEALADVAKGNETVEYACSLPQVAQGKNLKVSSQVFCRDERTPLGVVASIVPFNFPLMVPMWTLPIALVMGNCVVMKPSEKVPLTMYRTMELLTEAGVPPGVVNLVQGQKEAVSALVAHPDVRAVTFVGSSPVAKLVKEQCQALHKKCTALGGAKNHLVALSDCDLEETARDIVVSSMGCAGQRCMAASVLILVSSNGNHDDVEEQWQKLLLDKVIEKAKGIQRGTGPGQMGPVIDGHSWNKIHGYIQQAQEGGAHVLLDGRSWQQQQDQHENGNGNGNGNWIGPTIIHHHSKDDAAIKEEIFGPVLSVYKASSWKEAIEIENSNPFGNAACIYTSNGACADWFTQRFRAAMLGVNVGIPVPREPFSFGGLYGTLSKYGDMDITGDGAIEFFSNRIKVTTKWILPNPDTAGRNHHGVVVDKANFAGNM